MTRRGRTGSGPRPQGALVDHLQLIGRMARVTETDLPRAFEAGKLTPDDWAGMVRACRFCNRTDDCPDWLTRCNGGASAPDHCPNKAVFDRLGGRRES